jgi:methylphosphotriester-DNA--protein-cysteine methyltransferase
VIKDRVRTETILEVGLNAGFKNASHFARTFRKFVGASRLGSEISEGLKWHSNH